MSFFSKLFGSKEESNAVPEIKVEPTKISLKKLEQRKEILTVSLEKKSMTNTKARVVLAMDKTGSMQPLYYSGVVQETLERLLPIGLKLDDNAEIDVWSFNSGFKRLNSITEKDFLGFVNKIMASDKSWGGTYYSPVINDIVKKYTKEEPSDVPTYVIFMTDGENFDPTETERAIINASKYNIFWQFVGIGNEEFDFLRKLDDMDGRVVDNANFFEVNDISKITDTELYDKLLNEYPSWEKEARIKGILK